MNPSVFASLAAWADRLIAPPEESRRLDAADLDIKVRTQHDRVVSEFARRRNRADIREVTR